MNENTTPIIACHELTKTYKDGKLYVEVLKAINIKIMPGEQVAIVGASGAGKSTLLHILGGLEKPTQGEVFINGHNINKLTEPKRCELRNRQLGFIYQFHHLLPEFSVLENVCMPLLIRKLSSLQAIKKAKVILEKIGLSQRLQHKLSELSGGERQRTAIARALVTDPACVFADEPTGNLDNKTADIVYQTMLELNKEMNTSLVIVTHDTHLASQMDKCYHMENGRFVD